MPDITPIADAVLKIGGSLLSQSDAFGRVLAAVNSLARAHRLLIVPGGGPFADTVRDIDRRQRLSDEAAHWMAILAMDQYAHLLASKLDRSIVVHDREEIVEALAGGTVPVLAPSRWLRAADPLPHTWDVTSDSISAWVAGAVRAARVVLIKPTGAAGDLLDPYFQRALPDGVNVTILTADRIDSLASMLSTAIARS
jgi:aspartokinase-like uncharacterized kinase